MELSESTGMFSVDNPLAINQNPYLIDAQGGFSPLNQMARMKNIAFIDRTVKDYENLVAGIVPDTEIIILDPTRNGVEQITQVLASRTEISSAHIITHGGEANLQLGTAQLNLANLAQYRPLLEQWKNALTPDADILLYGCNIAAGEKGTAFVQYLSQLTDADIAASDNLTGSTVLGGDWEFEVKTGEIEATLALGAETMAGYDSVLLSFAPASNFTTSASQRNLTVGDFNKDGNPDIATAGTHTHQVSTLLGTGTGSFGTATNYTAPLGTNTWAVAVGDFNKDGNPDLVTANNGINSISLLLGDGKGNFGTATNFTVGSGPFSVAVEDFNKDGNLDVVTANQFSNNVSILLGDGTGKFSTPTNFAVGSLPTGVVVSDFNKDGNLDLAVANQNSRDIFILSGNGQGSFTLTNKLIGGGATTAIVAQDFNKDGNIDLATANSSSNNVSVLLGDGKGNFGTATNYGVGQSTLFIAAGDLNGDGNIDLATADNWSNQVSVLLGTSTGNFNSAISFSVGTHPQGIVIADLNKDGLLDIATANFGSQNVSVLLNRTPLVNFGAATFNPTEGSNDTVVNIPVTLSATPGTNVTVPIVINNGSTATEGAGNDYTLSTTSVTFAAGATGDALTQNIAVTIKPDNIPENDETVILNFGTITGAAAGTTNQTTLTIAANDAIDYAVSAGVANIPEGNSGTSPITFTVTRSGGIDAASQVDFAIGGTASNNSDYKDIGGTSGATSTTGTISFVAGETQKTITMNVVGDTVFEPDETVSVSLSNPVAPGPTPTISTASATTTINNDDPAPQPGTLQFSAANFSVPEGNSGTFVNSTVVTVNRTGGSSGAVSVQVRVNPNNPGTADANDYNNNAFPITVNFADGDTAAKTVVIPINGDTTVEPDETVNLELIPGSVTGGATIGSQNTAILTLLNDDINISPNPSTVSITATDASASEAANGQTANPGQFTLTRTGNLSTPLSVNYTTSGTATNGIDYNNLSGSVTFEANQSTVTLPINVINDNLVEGSETATVTITPDNAYIIGTNNNATVFIADTITVPQTINSTLSSTDPNNPTRSGKYRDDYRLTGVTPGQQVQVNLNAPFDAYLQLVNANTGQVIAFNDDSNGTLNSQLTFTAQAGIDYIVRVTSYRDGETGNYSLITSIPTPPTVTISATDAFAAEVVSGQTPNPGQFTIFRTGSTANSLTVNYTIGGTATNGQDYNFLPSSITMPAGASSINLPINVIDDNQAEGDEMVSLTLIGNSAYNLGNARSATVTIADNEPSIAIPTISGSQTINATLSTTDPNNPTRSGKYKDDYRLVGVTSGQTIQINLNAASFDTYLQLINADTGEVITFDDDSGEGLNSQLSLTVQPGINYLVRVTSFSSSATGNYTLITSAPPSVVTISATDAFAAEVVRGQTPNPGQFTISRTGNIANPLTVNYTIEGTATNGQDYNFLPGNILIPAGQRSVNLPINVIDDSLAEGNETAILTLAANSAYTIGSSRSATVTIADNEPFNRPPQQIINLRNSFRYPTNGVVTISNVYTDPDGDRLTYTATNSNGEPLPNWLQFSFNSDNNSITFTQISPPPSDWQSFSVRLTATDPWGASASQIFQMQKRGSGWVIDGYIAGATIFFDANKNGVRDANEPFTTTDNSGAYQLDIPPAFDTNNNGQFDPEEGYLVAFGGTDTATGLPLETPLVAPPSASVVTLLTSLVTELIDRGINPDAAESQVKAALSLTSDVNLTRLDPIAATNNNEPGAVEVLAAMVKVQNFITQTKGLIDGALGLPTTISTGKNDIVQGIVSAIANQIQSGASLDFSNSEQLAVIIEGAINKTKQLSTSFNPVVNREFIDASANIMAQVNQHIEKIVTTHTPESIHQQIGRVQKVALGEITSDFRASAFGTKSINAVMAENTGVALNTQIITAIIPGVSAVPIINSLPKLNSTLLFDSNFYLQQYKDVADAVANNFFPNALAHFSQFGWAEGRNPSSLFATDYLNKNSDVAVAVDRGFFRSGFAHFIRHGMAENRQGISDFARLDTFYLSQNSDVSEAVNRGYFGSGIEHLIRFGLGEGRNPFTPFNAISETFDPSFYLARNQDVAEAVDRGFFRNAFDHFVRFGLFESRNPSLLFENTSYLAQNSDVAAAVSKGFFRSALEHFIKHGKAEGRGVIRTFS